MKYLILLVPAVLLLALPMDKPIEELMQEQEIKKPSISSYDPFKRAKPLLNKKARKVKRARIIKPELVAVLNNKAFINGKWYEKGDYALGQKVMKVTKDSVYLKKGNTTRVLNLSNKKNSMFEIKEKEVK